MSLSPFLEHYASVNGRTSDDRSRGLFFLGSLQEQGAIDDLHAIAREVYHALAAYLEQIETWGTIYALVEAGKLEATGILAVKKC